MTVHWSACIRSGALFHEAHFQKNYHWELWICFWHHSRGLLKEYYGMDWTKKLLLALGLAVGCSSLIAFHGRAAYAPSEGQVSGQAEAASDPQLDLRLAKYYEIYASVLSFEERIAQAETANGGRK